MSLIGSLTSGVSAMQSFTKDLEVIGNNIANINTIGYKGANTSFADSFSNSLRSTAATQVGTGVKISSISTNFNQGAVSATGVATDLAVSGNGFFIVKNTLDDVTYATRAGDFNIDSDGYLTTSQGLRVQGLTGGSTTVSPPATIGDIQIGQNLPTDTAGDEIALQSYSIDTLGNITEYYADGSSAVTNRLVLQTYTNPSALQKKGDNLYTNLSDASPVGGGTLSASNAAGQNGLGTIEAGSLELSNVDLTDQFAKMITTQRSFQASSRIITVSDSVLEDIVNLKR